MNKTETVRSLNFTRCRNTTKFPAPLAEGGQFVLLISMLARKQKDSYLTDFGENIFLKVFELFRESNRLSWYVNTCIEWTSDPLQTCLKLNFLEYINPKFASA